MAEGINAQSMKIIGRWCRDEAYVWIRPITSKFPFPDKPAKQYWVVQVEIRSVEHAFTTWREEGFDINEIIAKLGSQVPRRKVDPRAAGALKSRKPMPGWLAPIKGSNSSPATNKKKGKSPDKKRKKVQK